jgi:hypothetical protein
MKTIGFTKSKSLHFYLESRNQYKMKNGAYLAGFIVIILAIGFTVVGITATHIQG